MAQKLYFAYCPILNLHEYSNFSFKLIKKSLLKLTPLNVEPCGEMGVSKIESKLTEVVSFDFKP